MKGWNPWAGGCNRRAHYLSPITDICEQEISAQMGITGAKISAVIFGELVNKWYLDMTVAAQRCPGGCGQFLSDFLDFTDFSTICGSGGYTEWCHSANPDSAVQAVPSISLRFPDFTDFSTVFGQFLNNRRPNRGKSTKRRKSTRNRRFENQRTTKTLERQQRAAADVEKLAESG